MIRRRNRDFYHLALSYICFGLVPTLIAGAVLFHRFKGNMEQAILDDMGRMVSYAARNAQEMVDESSSLTKRMYDIYTEDGRLLYQLLKDTSMEDQEKCTQMALFLEEMLEGDSRIRTAAFVDREGRIYYVTRNTQKVLDEDAFRQWISQQGYSGENFSVYPTHVDSYFTDSGNPVITFRRSYQDLTSFKTIGISLGNLYLDLDLGKLASALRDVGKGIHETFSIINGNGICIYSMDGPEIGKPLEPMMSCLSSMTGIRGSLTDAGQYVVYERMEGSGWIVAAQAGKDAVMGSFYTTGQYILIFLTGSFLVLVYLFSSLTKRVSRSEGLLEQGMMEIQTGNLGSRIDVGDKEDGISVLAAGFNNMARELESSMKKVSDTLEVIRISAMKHEDKETAGIAESLSRQMEYLIGSHSCMVPLEKEIGNIREYFHIKQIQYEDRFQLEVSVDEDVVNASIAKMSLQPIVENAVQHGLMPRAGDGTVRIGAHRKDDTLELTVMDDGVGMTEEMLAVLNAGLDQDGTGVQAGSGGIHGGIRNVRDRIHRNFGSGYGLEIMSTEGAGTVVVYCLPLILE